MNLLSLYVFGLHNDELEIPPSDCEVLSVVRFLTIESNSEAEIYCNLCAAYGKENVVNLRIIQGRTNIHIIKHEGQPSTMLHETVQRDCRLTITDIQREIARCFSHKAGMATIVCAL